MPSNIFVDVASINSSISQINRIIAQAGTSFYRINNGTGYEASPLQLDKSKHPLKIDAKILGNGAGWKGRSTGTVTATYTFSNTFTQNPIVVATFQGDLTTANVTITSDKNKAVVTVLTGKSGRKWTTGDKIIVHLIAIGI